MNMKKTKKTNLLNHESYLLQQGFTLVEVSVGATIMVIIGMAIVGLQYIIGQSQTLVLDQSVKIELANSSASELIREIRSARSGDNGAYVIESGDAQTLTFYSDVDFDGQAEKVRYFLQGEILRKGTIEPTGYPVSYPQASENIRVISEDVRNLTTPMFYYYDENWPQQSAGNPMSVPVDPDAVRMIRVYIRINTEEDDATGDYVIDSYAQLRTIKQNL